MSWQLQEVLRLKQYNKNKMLRVRKKILKINKKQRKHQLLMKLRNKQLITITKSIA
jgi:hypothetical protein